MPNKIMSVETLQNSDNKIIEEGLVDLSSTEPTEFKGFFYGDELTEECSEIPISFYVILGGAMAFVIFAAIVFLLIRITLKYKRKYYELLGSRESIFINFTFFVESQKSPAK